MVKKLAITVGAIVLIGVAVAFLAGGQLVIWIEQVWNTVWQWIQDLVTA